MTKYRVEIHLASGATITTVLESPEDDGIEDIVAELRDELEGDRRPGWREIGNSLVFSQAVSGVSVDSYATGGNPL